MITATKLAGFFAAHAIWCVAEGDTLIPMLAYTTERGENKMDRIVADNDLAKAVAWGQEKLNSNPMDANDAALLYDGRITTEAGKLDAIIIEIRAYFAPGAEAVFAVPYTPKQTGKLLVHKPKLVAWNNCEDFSVDDALGAFFEGVADHEKGSEVWNAHLDESK